jgi:RNA recognition motif-containing protein
MSQRGTAQGKYFVGGLARETTTESLKTYFEQFGELCDAIVMFKEGGIPRGFGFVTFSNPSAVPINFLQTAHIVDNKQVDVKSAVPQEEMVPGASPPPFYAQYETPNVGYQRSPPAYTTTDGISKLFIGGLTPTTTKEMLETHFSQFGTLTDSVVMSEEGTGKPRGFGFVTYQTEQQATAAVQAQGAHVIDNKVVDVKKAQPRGSPGLQPSLPARTNTNYNPYPATSYPPYYQSRVVGSPMRPALRAGAPAGAPRPTVGEAWEDSVTAPSKIFVGGLSRVSSEENLATHFSQYGSIQSCEVMRRDGVSRGFGFVVFSHAQEAARALNVPTHVIDGKQVEVKACQPRTPGPPAKTGFAQPTYCAQPPYTAAYASPAAYYPSPYRGGFRGRFAPY